MVHNYLRLTTHLVSNSTWSQHATALQADPALQRAIADVLLGRCLPATAAAVVDGEAPSGVEQGTHGVFTLFVMASTVQHRAILSMAQRWAGTNGAAAACGQAAAILAAVPLTRPSSMPEDRWSCNLCSAAALLAACCSVLASQASHHSPAGQADEAAGRSAVPPAGHTAAALQLADLLPQLELPLLRWQATPRPGQPSHSVRKSGFLSCTAPVLTCASLCACCPPCTCTSAAPPSYRAG